MANPSVKLTLAGTFLSVYATNATARARYWVDMAGRGIPSPNVLVQARQLLPDIGTSGVFFDVAGAPVSSAQGGFSATVSTHKLRVSSHIFGNETMASGQRFFVDVNYESRPKPTIERGSSATQQKTGTYLKDGAGGVTRAQMAVDWMARPGDFSPGGIPGLTKDPPDGTNIPFLKTPVAGTRMEFGASVRISSTWYNDELSQAQLEEIKFRFSTGINRFPLFFIGVRGFNDSRLWMCTAINSVSHDGGYSTRISGEFVFSPIGWDTIGIYNLPYSDQPAILSQDVLSGLYKNLSSAVAVPPPYLPRLGGAGRWPQQPAVSMGGLVGFLSQGTVLFSQPSVQQLLTNL